MVNPIGHWLWVPFCTRYRFPLNRIMEVLDNWITDSLKRVIRFPGSTGIGSSVTPSPGPSLPVFESSIYIFTLAYLGLIALWFHIDGVL